mgnify:CR=1 FL=1
MKSPIRIYHENSQGTSMNSNEKEFLLSSLISEAPLAPYCFTQLCIAASHFLISALLEPFAWLISD